MGVQKNIGIVGGGQLGKMLADAAHKLNFKVIVLDPTPKSPAALVADEQIVGSFKDKDKIFELAAKCDFITFETESANAEALEELEKEGKPINPSSRILKIIKDKFAQKTFLLNDGIQVAEFAILQNKDDAEKQGEIFGYPFLIKARFDAYDGKGNYVVKNKEAIDEAFNKLSAGPLYAEKLVSFEKELAVIAARDKFGTVVSFPVVETVHRNNICHIVRSPAQVSEEIKNRAGKLAETVLQSLEGVGVFGIEMFLLENAEILVNEIAPRVHNSGHHTIEAFSVSQFEQQIRAISGMPLVIPETKAKNAVMVNILGERDGEAKFERNYDNQDVNIHIYGKMETRKERKMGHITALAETLEEAEEKALKARKNISI